MNNGLLLWVDDEIEQLKAHLLFLEKKGYEVVTVSNGPDAIDQCREKNFDMVLLDEQMPGLSGLETLQRIKELQPALPVVMVTKSEEENIMEQAIGQKIADYLIKPVNPNQILLALKKNIHRREIETEVTQSQYQQNFQQNHEHIRIKPAREASLNKGGPAGNKDSSGNAAGCRFADPARGRKSSKAGECSHHYDQPEFDAVQFCSEPSVQDPVQTGCQPDDPGLVFSCTSFRIKAHRIPGFPFRADAVSESPVFQIVICDPYMIIGIVFIQIQLTGVHGPGFSRCVGNSRQAHSWQPYQYGCQHDKDRTNYFIQWNADLFLHNLYTTQLLRLR